MKTILNKVLGVLGAVLLVGMVAVVLWQIFPRTVLGSSNMVTEELARFGLVWFAMLSSAYIVGQKAHLAVTVLSKKLSGKRSKTLEVIVQSLFLVFVTMIMVYGGRSAVVLITGQISPSLSIPMEYVYLLVPVSGILIIIYNLVNLIDTSNNEPAIQKKI